MDPRENLKVQVLNHALIHVPFEGWSEALLKKTLQDCGIDPSYGQSLFPQGPRELISFWSHRCDQEMLALLPPPENMRVRDRITCAVKTRIMLLTPHREAARKTAHYLTCYPKEATRLLYKTVSEIWYYAGDTSTDYNFYTKRALLAWVYSATFLYWLKDNSEEFEKTWEFLDRRIAEVLAIPKYFRFPWKRHD